MVYIGFKYNYGLWTSLYITTCFSKGGFSVLEAICLPIYRGARLSFIHTDIPNYTSLAGLGTQYNTSSVASIFCFWKPFYFWKKKTFSLPNKTCFYKSTNIFKANTLVRCSLLTFPCFSVASIFLFFEKLFYFWEK